MLPVEMDRATLDADELWRKACAEFAPDGTLRDIYVASTSVDDWNTLVAVARRSGCKVEQSTRTEPLIHQLAEAHFHGDERAILTLDVAGMELVGHCFSSSEIELSFSPEQVRGAADLAALLRFLMAVAVTLQREVRITPENLPHAPILRIAASGDVRYIA